MAERVKKQKTFYSILGIIGDIVIYPIIIFSLIASGAMFVSRTQNALPSIFGLSLVYVSSGSMEKTGYMKGDVLFLVKSDPYKLKVKEKNSAKEESELERGDVIAFYSFADPADKEAQAIVPLKAVDNDVVLTAPKQITVENRIKVGQFPEEKKVKIVFHEITGRFIDQDGTLFFQTKGSSNSSPDGIKVRADYVVGKYVNTPLWIRSVFRFCASQIGMILLVVIPLGILIILQCFSLIEQTNNIIVEKSVISGKIRYDSKESLKANVGIEMNDIEKVRFYANAPEKERENVENFLWKYLDTDKPKDKAKYAFIKKAVSAFKENPEEYWFMWEQQIKGKSQQQKFKAYRQEWERKYDEIKKEERTTTNAETTE